MIEQKRRRRGANCFKEKLKPAIRPETAVKCREQRGKRLRRDAEHAAAGNRQKEALRVLRRDKDMADQQQRCIKHVDI